MTVASVSNKFLYCFKVSYQGAVVTANSRTPRIICLLSKTTLIPNKKQRAKKQSCCYIYKGLLCVCRCVNMCVCVIPI